MQNGLASDMMWLVYDGVKCVSVVIRTQPLVHYKEQRAARESIVWMCLCWISMGVGWRSNISEGRGQGLILKGHVVTFMDQRSEALQASGVAKGGGDASWWISLRACAAANCTVIWVLGKQINGSSGKKSAFLSILCFTWKSIEVLEENPEWMRKK